MIILLYIVLSLIVIFLLWRFLYFFRNPDRRIEYNETEIKSPADGFVVYIKKVKPGQQIFSIKKIFC